MVEDIYMKSNSFRPGILILILFFASAVLTFAQVDKKYIRQGNHEYDKEKFPESETSFRKALDKNKESADAIFNTGDALYKQKKYEEATRQFEENYSMSEDKKKKSASLYNMGNSLLMNNKVQESIEAYKRSLKLDPKNTETKYNLAYAQDLLKQQQNKKKNDNNDQDKKEPSEYAKKLKAEADKLISVGKFADAFNLMQEGLKKDQTVSYYQDFIDKTGKVAAIDLQVK
jgi:tetratricopeptide (TPR) repeat protein